jgi:PAS domain S-box-containing protein
MKKLRSPGSPKADPPKGEGSTQCRLLSLPPSHCCTIVESVSEGVLTIDLDKQVTYLNPAAEAMTGFTAREAIGQKCFDILRADVCERMCPFDGIHAGGEPYFQERAFIINKSATQLPVAISISPLRDERGKMIGAVETIRDLSELEELRRQATRTYTDEDIVGNHPRMREILSFLPDIAESESPVLIEGPTGSGKELIARAIHQLSPRKAGPFVAVNCAALPETLLESEIFGYAKGAFTGAVRNKAGRLSLANRGSLFLDEISSTSMAFQADLLRVLEEGEFTPLGGTRTLKSDFRVITATNLELKRVVSEGKFREDLYYRLNVAKISLPPLRERKEDIPLLIEHFIRKFNALKARSIHGVTPDVLSFLIGYPFPGNIRQLENIIEYAFITCKGRFIGMEHLSREIIEEAPGGGPRNSSPQDLEEAERIRTALEQHEGSRPDAARALGMSRTTLWRKMKTHGLLETMK